MKLENKILSENLFPVIGIGASAGGLDAFKKFLKAIPDNSGMAFVLVQHLDPKHESLLPELLKKVTHIPVLEITDDIVVKPNHIYVIPSNKIMVANDGILKLTPRPPVNKNRQNLPIDIFFTSLAEVHQTYAIGVVLSGTASDGTAGLKAIKDHGGLTFAQDKSATFDSMPDSAVKAGVVDFILPPEEIPQKILEITRNIQSYNIDGKTQPEQDEELIKKILTLLRMRKGTDFTYYKQTTIRRRIFRRMILNKTTELTDYLKYLRDNKHEIDILYQDLLIPVTSFFRDEKVFSKLCDTIIPQIVQNKKLNNPIRVWVAGCSTGEEAYSIAICFKDFLGDTDAENTEKRIQIFATDLSEPAIEKARIGIYSAHETDAVSSERLTQYFTKTKNGFKVNKSIRDMCVFAVHNFLKDPPFGRMDFISCRNVMIYMETYLQKKALTTFHYALKPEAYLLLGKSETTASVTDLFITVDKYNKLFSRKDVVGKFISIASQKSEQKLNNRDTFQKDDNTRNEYLKIADDIILRKYTPAGVIVNDVMDIIHFRGNTGKYLEQLPGKPSHNLIKLAKHGLGFELRNILHKAKKEIPDAMKGILTVRKENISVQLNDFLCDISLEVIPLPNTIEPYYLVLFHENNTVENNIKSIVTKRKNKDYRIQQLEKELTQIHEDMRSITEEQEAANEELQSDNEELLSSSEELQSLNEELETSKEELQCTNEELMVVNQEIINLNEQISEAKNYSEAIVATIHEPMIVLDKELRIKSANNSFYKNYKITEANTIGMLLYDLGNKQWNIPGLKKMLQDIILKNTLFYDYEIIHDFPNIGRRIMLLNASKIIQESQGEQLILLAIHDITESRMKALELQRIEKELLKKDISTKKDENEKLEHAVETRTKELIQVNKELVTQYIDKEKRSTELISINNELLSFTYIASHDLQEPLRKIQMFISKIIADKEQIISETNLNYFIRMQNSANRMQLLINDLLSYSKINTLQSEFHLTDLNLVMENVLEEFAMAQIIKETNTLIKSDSLPVVNGISFQLEQLLTNLLTNSIKYRSLDKNPVIHIHSDIVNGKDIKDENAVITTKYNKISITDNGIGFEQQYAEKIFILFQRLHEKDKYAGSGIGLTICKKIADNHHGFIQAFSVPNQGATFILYLPIVK